MPNKNAKIFPNNSSDDLEKITEETKYTKPLTKNGSVM